MINLIVGPIPIEKNIYLEYPYLQNMGSFRDDQIFDRHATLWSFTSLSQEFYTPLTCIPAHDTCQNDEIGRKKGKVHTYL